MRSPPGFRHPRYAVTRLVAEGGMGKVYAARDLLEDGLDVALKVYPARCNHARLRAEYLALKRLHHPGIARALHFGVAPADGSPFFTLELLRGRPLDAYLRGRSEPDRLKRAADLLLQAASAVACLHRRGILHLDLKPDNILVIDPGADLPPRAVLIDFGLVRHAEAGSDSVSHTTLPYAPPEALQGMPPSAASDVYSLAATFYRAISGRHAIECSDPASFARLHRQLAPKPLPEASPALERILLRALVKDPAKRFQNAGELEDALLKLRPEDLGGFDPSGRAVPFHEPDFVGRKAEVKAFEAWLEAGSLERPVFAVRGGAGWGKTRFLEEAETILESRHREVLSLRGGGAAGWPLLDRALKCVDLLEGEPERPKRLKGKNPPGKPSGRRAVASAEEARLVGRRVLSRILPLLKAGAFLLVDDVHLATPLEREWLEDVAAGLRATGRPGQGGILAAWTPTSLDGSTGSRPWKDASLAEEVELGAFSVDEALSLDLEGLDGALARFPRGRAEALKRKLHAATGGHPLFFVRGLLDLAGGGEEATRLAPTERLESELKRLAPSDRLVAACLALLGRAASASEVGGVLGLPESESGGALERLRWRGLLAGQGGKLRIVHEQMARAVTALLPPGEIERLHASIAERMAAQGEADSFLEAARHFFAAGDGPRGLALARRWCSGERSGFPVTYGDVETLRRAALQAGRSSPDGLLLKESAGDVLETLGRFEDCVAEREEASELSEAAGAPQTDRIRRRRKLGVACHRSGLLDRAVEHLEWCVEPARHGAAPADALRARADLALLHHFRGEADLALAHAQSGIGAWRKCPSALRAATVQSAVNFLTVEGQVLFRRMDLEAALRVLEEGARLAERSHFAANTALLLNNLALANHLAGRLDAALGMFEKAEEIARELGDAAALVSIRYNVAQILARQGRFRKARLTIDEVDESTAVAQSKRLLLGAAYTQGLYLSLLGVNAGDVWSRVEALARDAGDPFLERFASLHGTESLVAQGDYSRAQQALEHGTDAQIEAPRLARLAWVEALLGKREAARAARSRFDLTPRGPELLASWSQLLAAASAIETGNLDEALQRTGEASRFFRSAGASTGELECALLEAEAAIREAARCPDPRKLLDRAERCADKARKVPLDPPQDLSPRARDLRTALVEARALLIRLREWLRAITCPPAGRPPRVCVDARSLEARLRDLLARAGGDPTRLSEDHTLLLDCVAGAAHRWLGDVEAASRDAARVRSHLAQAALRLAPQDREAFATIDPWQRFGLKALEPLAGDARFQASHAESLASILRLRATAQSAKEAMQGGLRIVLEALGAASVVLAGPTGAAFTSVAPGVEARTEGVGGGLIWARIAPGDIGRGWLAAVASRDSAFSASDEAFLAAAALALGSQPVVLNGLPPSKGSVERTAQLAMEAPAGSADSASSLSRTRPLTQRSLRSGDLARILRKEGIIAEGRAMARVVRAAAALAASDLPVLITGDSGTGKNLIAKLIHLLSPRSEQPFLSQSASAVPPELFEADLFGYERGAFTGAERTRTGYLFQAAGGTFHLEEIGDLEPALQQRFLRVLDERSVRPLGAASPRTLDVRFIASTQKDLEAMVRRGELRKDLYYRLGNARIHIPALAERRDELGSLVDHFWCEIFGPSSRFPKAALAVLARHDWPGNVRELVGTLRRLSIESGKDPSAAEARAALGDRTEGGPFPASLFESQSYEEVSRKLEVSYLEHLLGKHSGSLEAIAAALGTTTRSVYRRFERLGLKPKDLHDGR